MEIAADAFSIPVSEAFEREVYAHLEDHNVLFLFNEGIPVGFASLKHFSCRNKGVMYVAGLVVKQDFQSNGAGQTLVKEGLRSHADKGMAVDYIAGRTQNPVVARARRRYTRTLFPIYHEPTDEVVGISQMLREYLRMTGEFDDRTLVGRNTYEHPLYRSQSGDEKIDAFFDQNVGQLDSVFIIGEPKL